MDLKSNVKEKIHSSLNFVVAFWTESEKIEGRLEAVIVINGTNIFWQLFKTLEREKSKNDYRLLFLQMSKVTKIGMRRDEMETFSAVLCHLIWISFRDIQSPLFLSEHVFSFLFPHKNKTKPTKFELDRKLGRKFWKKHIFEWFLSFVRINFVINLTGNLAWHKLKKKYLKV